MITKMIKAAVIAAILAVIIQSLPDIKRYRTSLRDIVNSPEARRMAGQAVAVAGSIVGRGSARGATATVTGLARLVIHHVTEAIADKETSHAA